MKALWGIIYFTCFVSLSANCQTYWINKTPFLDTLYRSEEDIAQIAITDYNHFLPVFYNNQRSQQTIIKNKNGLFILIDGTGQVYKAGDTLSHKMAFTRIDSTLFSGNDFAALIFSRNDTIFSFGGYGFWHMNGQLRYFNQGAEWNVKRINKEFSGNRNCSFYSKKDSKIYYPESKNGEEIAFSQNNNNNQIIELDLETLNNKVLGTATQEAIPLLTGTNFCFLPSLNGLLIVFKRDYYLIKYQENSIYKLNNETIRSIFYRNSTKITSNLFEKNGKLYFTNFPEYQVRNLPISMNDFALLPYRIYNPDSISNNNYLLFAGGSICLIAIGLLPFIVFKRKRKGNKQEIQTPLIENTPINENEFTYIEHKLIELIITCNAISKQISTEQINSTLGISKKSIEVQKKVRGDTINRINHKFKVIFDRDSLFIERYRSEIDRRSYNYVINKENTALYQSKYKTTI